MRLTYASRAAVRIGKQSPLVGAESGCRAKFGTICVPNVFPREGGTVRIFALTLLGAVIAPQLVAGDVKRIDLPVGLEPPFESRLTAHIDNPAEINSQTYAPRTKWGKLG
jgi:hypothetical protein